MHQCHSFWQAMYTFLVDTAQIPLRAGNFAVKRSVTDIATICQRCQRLPTLWREACAGANHTCVPRVLLSSHLLRTVLVQQGGCLMALPNIHPQLLLLAQLQPGMRRVGVRATG